MSCDRHNSDQQRQTENEHRDHVLKVSRAPADVSAVLGRAAIDIVTRIATAFDYVGVLAVEMFVLRQGDKETGERDRAASA